MKITRPVGVKKDGYASGGVDVKIPSQNLEMDPRGLSSFRGKGVYIAQGDKNEIKGTRRMLKSKDKTVTWF